MRHESVIKLMSNFTEQYDSLLTKYVFIRVITGC